jgi:hypothetical protein
MTTFANACLYAWLAILLLGPRHFGLDGTQVGLAAILLGSAVVGLSAWQLRSLSGPRALQRATSWIPLLHFATGFFLVTAGAIAAIA